ncbi:MAG TPA: xanthine dehydrogenase accessory protein XdhC [Burkholderiales bacterium]|jgi:xanthine dehydrogenase accessory factor|nr:xanthine dehydrogenase accessory protein XdhC [Burkholderiales bacterium]
MSYIEIRVVETRGSTPRESGTRMWVGASEIRGTIGGGNLEYTALKIAREMLLSGETERQRRFVLGDALGQCCGGNTTLAFKRAEEIEGEEDRFDVVLFGAGHVGKEVARILERVPCRLTWVDQRPEQFPSQTSAQVVIEDEPIFAVDEAPPGAFYVVMTHSHALDYEIVERALQRKDARFVGMIGSETKAAKLRSRLKTRRIDASRLVSPIGLFKAGKHPAEVAVSAVAQLLQLRQEAISSDP